MLPVVNDSMFGQQRQFRNELFELGLLWIKVNYLLRHGMQVIAEPLLILSEDHVLSSSIVNKHRCQRAILIVAGVLLKLTEYVGWRESMTCLIPDVIFSHVKLLTLVHHKKDIGCISQ